MRRLPAFIFLGLSAAASDASAVDRTTKIRAEAAGTTVYPQTTVVIRTAEELIKSYPPGTTLVIPDDTIIKGPIILRSTGTKEKPIVVTRALTPRGKPPQITGGGAQYGDALTVGSNTIVRGLLISDSNRYGVAALRGTSNVIIDNNEITRVGTGVAMIGDDSKMIGNYVHDLTLIRKIPSKAGENVDYGANGVVVGGYGNEIGSNRFVANKALGASYGLAGGAIRLQKNTANLHVHHNWAEDCAGFIETSGVIGEIIENNIIENNTAFNLLDHPFLMMHNRDGIAGVAYRNNVIKNNTILATKASPSAMSIFYFDAKPVEDSIRIVDNVVSLNSGDSVFKYDGEFHAGNVFDLKSKTTHLFNNWTMKLGPDESFLDVRFMNIEARNLRLVPDSRVEAKGAYPDAPVTASTGQRVTFNK